MDTDELKAAKDHIANSDRRIINQRIEIKNLSDQLRQSEAMLKSYREALGGYDGLSRIAALKSLARDPCICPPVSRYGDPDICPDCNKKLSL